MLDAEQEHSLCGDVYAKRFMNDYGRRVFDDFKSQTNSNASMIVRHRIIDDVLRQKLAADPALRIVSIGAGFDSRPYRLQGGSWFELDEPEVVAYKNARLPEDDCRNPLRRIAIDFERESLECKLAAIASDAPTVMVMEGVVIYLNEAKIGQVLACLKRLFPRHELICDLVSREMVESYGQELREKVARIHADFEMVDRPEKVFAVCGYRIVKAISVAERSIDLGLAPIPKFVLKTLFKNVEQGNAIYVFEPFDPYPDLVI